MLFFPRCQAATGSDSTFDSPQDAQTDLMSSRPSTRTATVVETVSRVRHLNCSAGHLYTKINGTDSLEESTSQGGDTVRCAWYPGRGSIRNLAFKIVGLPEKDKRSFC